MPKIPTRYPHSKCHLLPALLIDDNDGIRNVGASLYPCLYLIPWCTGLLTFKSFPHSSTEIRIRLPRSIPQPRSRVRVAHEPSSRRRFRFPPHSSFTFCSVTAPPQQSLCPRALTVTLVSRPNIKFLCIAIHFVDCGNSILYRGGFVHDQMFKCAVYTY